MKLVSEQDQELFVCVVKCNTFCTANFAAFSTFASFLWSSCFLKPPAAHTSKDSAGNFSQQVLVGLGKGSSGDLQSRKYRACSNDRKASRLEVQLLGLPSIVPLAACANRPRTKPSTSFMPWQRCRLTSHSLRAQVTTRSFRALFVRVDDGFKVLC